jgi:hypothetical protein
MVGMTDTTPTFKVAELTLGKPLRPWIRARRRKGDSWRLIAIELGKTTGVDVTGETVRFWMGDSE